MPSREPRLWSSDAGASWTRVGFLVDANGIAQTVMAQLTGGVFLTGFALALGARSFAIGLLAAIPLAAKLSQLALSAWIERSGRWTRVAIASAVFARLSMLVIPVLAFLPGATGPRLVGVIVVLAISSLAACIYELAFLTWMAELIPEPLRGVFWGKRGRNAGFVGIAASIGAAALIDVPSSSSIASQPRFGVVFACGAIIGCLGVLFLRRLPEARRKHRRDALPTLLAVVAAPLTDLNFRWFIAFSALWSFAAGAMAPFYTVYMLRQLHLSFLEITLLTALTNVLMAVTQTHWGRLGDHFGTKPVLRIGAYLIALTPFCWLATSPTRVWPVILVQVLSGVGWSAFHVSQNNLALKLSPLTNRPSYLASFGALVGVSEGLAPLVAGVILGFVSNDPTPTVGVFHVMMGVQLVLFALATELPARIGEPGGAPVGHLIRVMARFRTMDASRPVGLMFDYTYTHLARIADFIAREFPRDAEPL